MGFCFYYQKFIKGFSSLAKPLYVLMENQAKFSWDEQCRSFMELKQNLSSSPMLAFKNEEGEFILNTDASNIGIGGLITKSGRKRKSNCLFQPRTK